MKTFRLIALMLLSALCVIDAFGQIPVSLPTTVAQVGTTVNIAVTTGSVTGQNIAAYSFSVSFDTSIVGISSVDVNGTISQNLSGTATNPSSDLRKINAAYASSGPSLSGSGTLINLVVQMKKLGTSNLTFNSFSYEKLSGEIVPSTTTNGSLDVRATANQRPTIGAISAKTVMETDTLRFTVTATDPDAGEVLTYSASNLPTGASFNASTRTFQWVPTVGQQGAYNVTFKVTDLGGLTDSTTASITVTKKNTKPTFTPVSAKTVNEKDTLRFTVSATDPENDPLTYSAVTPLPTGATFTASTRTFLWVPNYQQNGSFTVRFVVSDGLLTDTLSVSITVNRTNAKPVFAAVGSQTGNEKDTLRFTVTATDPNNDPLTYSAIGLPTGASFTASTRTFLWVPDTNQAGSYGVRFIASDGVLADTITVSITVKNILVVINPITDKTLPDGGRLYKQKLSGANRVFSGNVGTLTFTASSSNTTFVEASILAGDTLQVRGKINSGSTVVTVTVTATDVDGTTKSTTFRATVTGVTDAEPVQLVPTEFGLAQNYPNPFNPSTTIRFSLPKEAPVTLEIYNVLGVRVRTLIAGETMNAAFHSIVWDGKDESGLTVPSGVYLYRIQAGDFHASRKMALIK